MVLKTLENVYHFYYARAQLCNVSFAYDESITVTIDKLIVDVFKLLET